MPVSKRRKAAVPFVLTVALLPACGGSEVHPNPPGPDPTVHPNPPAPDPTPSSTQTSAPVATGSPPPSNVTKSPDGKCYQHAEVHCPKDATCNPPPPKQVPCP